MMRTKSEKNDHLENTGIKIVNTRVRLFPIVEGITIRNRDSTDVRVNKEMVRASEQYIKEHNGFIDIAVAASDKPSSIIERFKRWFLAFEYDDNNR